MTNEPVEHRSPARATLAISCAATLLVLINFTTPIPTVQVLAKALGSGPSGQTWILGSISIGLAACLMVAGTLADDHGRKRIFTAGGTLLVLASAVCALAPTTAVFVVGRVVQGGASAALLASSLGLLGHAFPPGPERARATGLWGAMVGGGIAIGPVYSALLIKVAPWQTAYWIIAAVSALVTLWGLASLTESRAEQRRRFDAGGVVTVAAGVSLLIAALIEGRGGWTQPHVLAFLVAALVLLAGFVWIEKRAADPMLDLQLLRRPAFVASAVGALVTGIGVIGFMTYIPISAQKVLGMSPLQSALVLAIWSGLSFVAAPQARRMVGRVGDRQQVAAGLAVCGVGELALIGIDSASPWWQFVPGMALAGIGSGVVNAALAGLAVRSVPAHRVAMGSAAGNASRYLGSSIGVALMAAILALSPRGGGPAHEMSVGMNYAGVVAGALAVLGAVLVALCRERPRPRHAVEVPGELELERSA
ncbi:MFS transporter [Streptomyces gamaensis]|uniref:MFS transporter n=1 Tax=Streptomyces gamaensis TaxID=1763542 RepID=A0ABW0Z7C7_9ACTN